MKATAARSRQLNSPSARRAAKASAMAAAMIVGARLRQKSCHAPPSVLISEPTRAAMAPMLRAGSVGAHLRDAPTAAPARGDDPHAHAPRGQAAERDRPAADGPHPPAPDEHPDAAHPRAAHVHDDPA